MSATGEYCVDCGRYEELDKLVETIDPGHFLCMKCISKRDKKLGGAG